MTPHDPFGRSSLPSGFSREERVALLDQAADALLRGEVPPDAARMLLGSALRAFLDSGDGRGALEGRYLRITARRGSHETPGAVLARMKQDGKTEQSTHGDRMSPNN
jgi:hypothetical protein